jgi:hypothetical protein
LAVAATAAARCLRDALLTALLFAALALLFSLFLGLGVGKTEREAERPAEGEPQRGPASDSFGQRANESIEATCIHGADLSARRHLHRASPYEALAAVSTPITGKR